jgi:hypothetical protein
MAQFAQIRLANLKTRIARQWMVKAAAPTLCASRAPLRPSRFRRIQVPKDLAKLLLRSSQRNR